MRLDELADPAAVEKLGAWLAEQERLEAGAVEYPEFLRLSVLEERTPEQEASYQELRATYDPAAPPEQVDDAQARRDRGEEVSLDDAIMLDAAYRASKPRNSEDWRYQRGRSLAARVFRGPTRVHHRLSLHRGSTSRRSSRRTVRLAANSPPGRPRPSSGDDDPHHDDVVPVRAIVVEIEGGGPRVTVTADSLEDQHALLAWLRRRPRVIAKLGDVQELLDQLERGAA